MDLDPLQPKPDALEQFLAGAGTPTLDPAFQDALLRTTLRHLRRRRRRQRLVVMGAVAASFLAGVVCTQLWQGSGTEAGRHEQAVRPITPPERPAAKAPDQPPDKIVPAALPRDAVVMEWHAFDDPQRRQETYRQAGDLYVEENHDYEAALRCYTQALDSAANGDITMRPDDNWLVMALKQARRKEQSHAKNGG